MWTLTSCEKPVYDPDVADLGAWVLAPSSTWGTTRRLFYSLVTNEIWDTLATPNPKVVELTDRLRTCRLWHLYKRAGGDKEDVVTVGELAELPTVQERIMALITIARPMTEGERTVLNFNPVLPQALSSLLPNPNYWWSRMQLTTQWIDFANRVVFTKHPVDRRVVMATDLADMMLQGFHVCTGLMVTGKRGEEPDHLVTQEAPIFAVTKFFDGRTHADMLERFEEDDYLEWLPYWHSPPEEPMFTTRVNLEGEAWKSGGTLYKVVEVPEDYGKYMAWYFAYQAVHHGEDHKYLPARYQENYRQEEAGPDHPCTITVEPKSGDDLVDTAVFPMDLEEWWLDPELPKSKTPLKEVFLPGYVRPYELVINLLIARDPPTEEPPVEEVDLVSAEEEKAEPLQVVREEAAKPKGPRGIAGPSGTPGRGAGPNLKKKGVPKTVKGQPKKPPVKKVIKEGAGEDATGGEYDLKTGELKSTLKRRKEALPTYSDFVYREGRPVWIPTKKAKLSDDPVERDIQQYLITLFENFKTDWRYHIPPGDMERLGISLPKVGVPPTGGAPGLELHYKPRLNLVRPTAPLPAHLLDALVQDPDNMTLLEAAEGHYLNHILPSKAELTLPEVYAQYRVMRRIFVEVLTHQRQMNTDEALKRELEKTKQEVSKLKAQIKVMREREAKKPAAPDQVSAFGGLDTPIHLTTQGKVMTQGNDQAGTSRVTFGRRELVEYRQFTRNFHKMLEDHARLVNTLTTAIPMEEDPDVVELVAQGEPAVQEPALEVTMEGPVQAEPVVEEPRGRGVPTPSEVLPAQVLLVLSQGQGEAPAMPANMEQVAADLDVDMVEVDRVSGLESPPGGWQFERTYLLDDEDLEANEEFIRSLTSPRGPSRTTTPTGLRADGGEAVVPTVVEDEEEDCPSDLD